MGNMNVSDMRDKTTIDYEDGHTITVWRSKQTGTWRGHMRDEEGLHVDGTYIYGYSSAHLASRAVADWFNSIYERGDDGEIG